MLSLHMSGPLAFAMLAQLSSATTIPTQWGCSKDQVKNTTTQLATFDDILGIPGAALPGGIPTPYKFLDFQAFDLVNVIQTLLPLPGVLPHSKPNYAGTGVAGQTLGGNPMLTLNYQNNDPNIKTFDLSSFYYGCTLDTVNGAVGVPTECRVTVTGFKGNDNTISDSTQVCSKSFEYHPTTMLGAQQQAFTSAISGCKDLTHAVFTYQPMGGQVATASALALVLDSLKYNVNGCKKY